MIASINQTTTSLEFDDLIAEIRGAINYFQTLLEPRIHKPGDIDTSKGIFNMFEYAKKKYSYSPTSAKIYDIIGQLDTQIQDTYRATIEKSFPRKVMRLIWAMKQWQLNSVKLWPNTPEQEIPLLLLKFTLDFAPSFDLILNTVIFDAVQMLTIKKHLSGKTNLQIENNDYKKIDLINLYGLIGYLYLSQSNVTIEDIKSASKLFREAKKELKGLAKTKDIDPITDQRFHYIGKILAQIKHTADEGKQKVPVDKQKLYEDVNKIIDNINLNPCHIKKQTTNLFDTVKMQTEMLNDFNLEQLINHCNALFVMSEIDKIEKNISEADKPQAILRVLQKTRQWLKRIESEEIRTNIKTQLISFCESENIEPLFNDTIMDLASKISYKNNTLVPKRQHAPEYILISYISLNYGVPSIDLLSLVNRNIDASINHKKSTNKIPSEIRPLYNMLDLDHIQEKVVDQLKCLWKAELNKPLISPNKTFYQLQKSLIHQLKQKKLSYTRQITFFSAKKINKKITALEKSINDIKKSNHCYELQEALKNSKVFSGANQMIRRFMEYKSLLKDISQATTLKDIANVVSVGRSPFLGILQYHQLRNVSVDSAKKLKRIKAFCKYLSCPNVAKNHPVTTSGDIEHSPYMRVNT